MTHIRVILPAHSTRACNMTMLKPYESAELKISLSYAEMEASSMRTSFEINLFSNATLQKVIEAEQEGVDAIVISLMGEIATTAMLEAVSIPVVSLPKIAFFTAVSLAYRFSIVSTTPQIESVQVPLITKYVLSDN